MSRARPPRFLLAIGIALGLGAGLDSAVVIGACRLIYAEDAGIKRVFPYNPNATIAERRAVDLLFEPLVRTRSDGTFESMLLDLDHATVSADRMEWTFPLKPTVWHSGKPLTAEQISKTHAELQRLNAEGYEDWVSELSWFRRIAEMRPAGNSLVVRYRAATDAQIAQQSLRNFYVIPWDDLPRLCSAFRCHLDEYVALGEEPRHGLVGNGRWMSGFGARGMISAADEIALASFDGFPNGETAIEEVLSRFQPISKDRANMFKNGQVNVVLEAPPSLLTTLLNQVQGAVELVHGLNTFDSIQISSRNPALQEEQVRQAIVFALDRAAILDVLYGGKGYVLDAPFPPDTPCYNPAITPREQSRERVFRLLSEAGFKGSPETGWRKGGYTLDNLELLIESTLRGAEDQFVVQKIIDQLGEVGIRVIPVEVSPGEAQQRLREGTYDLYMNRVTMGNAWDVRWVLSLTLPGRPENRNLICHPEVEKLMKEYQETIDVDPVSQGEVGRRLHAAIAEHCDRIYLWSLIRKGVFNSTEIEFECVGATLFENPEIWKCHQ